MIYALVGNPETKRAVLLEAETMDEVHEAIFDCGNIKILSTFEGDLLALCMKRPLSICTDGLRGLRYEPK